ncbi:type II secretion system protein N [Limnohabitans sp.]|uniref:type II secretion system protein N n=1 Tax=Limnohabitans sp. TaxID=1907725 RepID=UPI002AFFCB37|nr:type II secretion system protein N [Limnohabitans sp.]
MLRIQTSSGPYHWAVKSLTGLVWFLAAGAAVVWTLKFPVQTVGMPVTVAQAPAVQTGAQLSADVARSLGHRTASPSAPLAADLRFQLLGVIAGGSGSGSALISVGGLPPKAFKVGQTITEGVVLQRLQARRAELGTEPNGQAQWTLELPANAAGLPSN